MPSFGKRQLHELYFYLRLIRRLETELARLFREGKLVGPLPISNGQEAIGLGSAYPLRPGDFLASAIPSNGAVLARGVKPSEIFAHFMGKTSSLTGGHDGTLEPGDLKKGLVAPTGHLATHLSVMAGIAFAARTERKDAVAVALVGERAIGTGDFHEGLNFAAVHQLPLVVVLEKTPVGLPESDAIASTGLHLYERFRGYGVASLMVDGNDILQVLRVVEAAVDRARSGTGPTFIEARTAGKTRFSERTAVVSLHRDAPDKSQQRELDFEDGELNDPVEQFETFLVEHGLMQQPDQEQILERIERLVVEDSRRADEEPDPLPESLSEGVYHAPRSA
jgi:TPP-dependent pyruvate/acetoin dehydrogenase alpha subunit